VDDGVGNREEPQRTSIGLPPEGTFPGRKFYFLFLGAFAFSVLTFRFVVFPGGTHPQPQFIFLAIMSPPSVFFLFLQPVNVDIRRCTAWRSPAGAGTSGNSSPPS